MEMKYIITQATESSLEEIHIFSNWLSHREMYDKLRTPVSICVSAGFVQIGIEKGGISAYGESDSLGIKSRPTDTALIYKNMSLYSY
jgi:hypothetical protein